jgi:anti-sigma B factor antagonist
MLRFVFRQLQPDVTVMDLTGPLSMPGITVVELERAIRGRIEQGVRKLVLDLANVNFLDSSGVGLLVVCSSAMERAGGRMVLVGAAGPVKQVLGTVHLDRVIGMFPDLTCACEAMTDGRRQFT